MTNTSKIFCDRFLTENNVYKFLLERDIEKYGKYTLSNRQKFRKRIEKLVLIKGDSVDIWIKLKMINPDLIN